MQQENSESIEEEISLIFKVAIVKLDKIETQVKKDKTQVVQDVARDLEGKIPTDTIAIEIVHQLRGRVSERLIHDCLEEKYKKKHRVENARKRKETKQSDEILAAPVLLNHSKTNQESNKALIYTSARPINESQSPRSNAQLESSAAVDSNSEVSFPLTKEGIVTRDCSQCKKYEIEIQELGNARKIIDVTVFEFFMPLEELRRYMEPIFRETAGRGNAWFHGTLDIRTGRVTEVATGPVVSRISEEIREGSGTVPS